MKIGSMVQVNLDTFCGTIALDGQPRALLISPVNTPRCGPGYRITEAAGRTLGVANPVTAPEERTALALEFTAIEFAAAPYALLRQALASGQPRGRFEIMAVVPLALAA